MTYGLYRTGERERLATVSEADRQVLVGALEEESPADRDYYVDADTLDLLAGQGLSPSVVAALRSALAGGEGIDIEWRPDP